MHPMGNVSSSLRKRPLLNKVLPFTGTKRDRSWTRGLSSLSQRKAIKHIKCIWFLFSSCWLSQPQSQKRAMRSGRADGAVAASCVLSSPSQIIKWDGASVPTATGI